jgi:hypothetical protein
MLKSIIVALLGIAAFNTSSMAEVIPNTQRDVLAGQIAAFKGPNDEFSHCGMQIGSSSGVAMHFSVLRNHTRRIGWSHGDWRFPLGQRVNIFLFFDGIGPHNLPAVARATTFATADLLPTAGILDLMRKANQMTVVAEGNRYKFSLDETSAALTELVSCVNRFTQPARTLGPAIIASGQEVPLTPTATDPTKTATTKSELLSFSRR